VGTRERIFTAVQDSSVVSLSPASTPSLAPAIRRRCAIAGQHRPTTSHLRVKHISVTGSAFRLHPDGSTSRLSQYGGSLHGQSRVRWSNSTVLGHPPTPCAYPGSAISSREDIADSEYNSLQGTLRRQRRSTLGIAYTWSHSLDDASRSSPTSQLARHSLQHASSDFDQRQIINISYIMICRCCIFFMASRTFYFDDAKASRFHREGGKPLPSPRPHHPVANLGNSRRAAPADPAGRLGTEWDYDVPDWDAIQRDATADRSTHRSSDNAGVGDG